MLDRRSSRLALLGPLVLLLGTVLLLAPALPARAEAVPDAVRKKKIKKLGRTLAKKARSPRAPKYKAEILDLIEALGVLGGPEAAEASLRGVPMDDPAVRDRIFALVEKEHAPALVAPLAALLEAKPYRRDFDLRKRVARSLAVMADFKAVEPLARLVRTDEDANVVATAAESLATYAEAPLPARKVAVKRLIDTYTTTYNLMLSMKPDQKVIASLMKKRYKIYARPIRGALQALTGQQLTRPQDWRTWWNKHKKDNDW
ncbi:MAG: hypothetical protein ACC662_09655 [Planctomycetota bacterium]